MGYFLNLFTPETWQVFRKAGARVTGLGNATGVWRVRECTRGTYSSVT